MRTTGTSSILLILASLVWISPATAPQPPASPSLDALLRAAGDYVAVYEAAMTAVVAEEDYTQQFKNEVGREGTDQSGTRRLRSDLLTVRPAAGGWVGFRDVFEVDGKPVRDRDERLLKLFLQGESGAFPKATQIAEESARFNLMRTVSRTINTPLLALQFLRPANQARSTFSLDGGGAVDGIEAVVLEAVERAKPRFIRTKDDAAARGRFWIEPASGRVLRTQVWLMTGTLESQIQVTYGSDAKVGLWVPISMEEKYVNRPYGIYIDGHAAYANFRKFSVNTGEVMKP